MVVAVQLTGDRYPCAYRDDLCFYGREGNSVKGPFLPTKVPIPPDARPTARVLGASGEQAREGALIAIAGRPVVRNDPDGGLGPQPGVEPVAEILDGP